MMRKLVLLSLGLLLFLGVAETRADTMLMVRTTQSFPEAMLKLQESIRSKGYSVSRVQRVDIGLTKSGYMTDKYRVVFFGKAAQVRELTDKYPYLIPYLPLKIAIFAEGEETLLVAANPTQLNDKAHPELEPLLKQFEKDLNDIFSAMRVE